MELRLTEKHYAYGEAGLVFPGEQLKYAHWSDRYLFEPIEDELQFTCVEVRLNNHEFKYLTFSTQELLLIIMKYMEPANRKYLQFLTIVCEVPSINHLNMFKAMKEMATMYDFDAHIADKYWKFDYVKSQKAGI